MTTCINCEAGKFQDQKKAAPSYCKECDAGKWQDQDEQTMCKGCGEGKFSVSGGNQLKDTPFRSSAIDSMESMDAIGTVCTYAVYAGHYSINGSYMLQGGAISAIFDYATACIGTTLFNPGSFALTKSVTTNFLRGANPVPGIFKVVCEVIALDLNAGSMTLKSSLTNVSNFF